MRKLLLLLLFFGISLLGYAQSYQKYNDFLDRTEFYDSYGNMTGYAKYNSFLDRVEYYDSYGHLKSYKRKMNSSIVRRLTRVMESRKGMKRKITSYTARRDTTAMATCSILRNGTAS